MPSSQHRPLPKNANVPRPSNPEARKFHTKTSGPRSLNSQEVNWYNQSQRIARFWSKEAPEYKLPEVDLDILAKRSKPSKLEAAIAQKTMDTMAEWPSDSCSGRWYNKNGKLMVAYFADRLNKIVRAMLLRTRSRAKLVG